MAAADSRRGIWLCVTRRVLWQWQCFRPGTSTSLSKAELGGRGEKRGCGGDVVEQSGVCGG